jgi:hypothetical protein
VLLVSHRQTGKPVARRGRKATGLPETAELPKGSQAAVTPRIRPQDAWTWKLGCAWGCHMRRRGRLVTLAGVRLLSTVSGIGGGAGAQFPVAAAAATPAGAP